jgi:ABC-type antimicrobial peptide transport system permease subunit
LNATLLVRAASDPSAFARRIPDVVHEVDARQPVSRIQTLEAVRNRSLAPPRLTALLVTLFAAVALVITAAGIAGVVSFLVNQRTTEIGVRMALGAPRSSVVRMILGQGLGPVAAGLVLGIGGALMLTRVVTRLLRRRADRSADYVAVAITLAVVAALACLAPRGARRRSIRCARCAE